MGSRSMISSRRPSDENSSNSADKSPPDEETPLLVSDPQNGILSNPESHRKSKNSFPADPKATDEEAADDLNGSINRPEAKPDASIVGIISVLLLGTEFSQGGDFHTLTQECHSRLFYRQCRRLNRISNIRYYLFGDRQSRQWELADYYLHAGRMCHSANCKQDDFILQVIH